MPTKTIIIPIESCDKCIYSEITRDSQAPCNGAYFKWYCKKLRRFVRRAVPLGDKEEFIPNDCPLEDRD